MDELTLTLIKIGFLALLWLFVLSSVSVIKSDMFGERVDASRLATAKAGKPPKPVKPSRRQRSNAPTRLVISEGANAGITVPLSAQPILLGRGADATIRLDDDYVSTRHARFVPHGDDWYIEDLGSTNGTYLGHQRVTAPTPIGAGTAIRIGKTVLELRR